MDIVTRFENLDKALEIKSKAKGLLNKRKEVTDSMVKLQTQLDGIDKELETFNSQLDELLGAGTSKKGRKGKTGPRTKNAVSLPKMILQVLKGAMSVDEIKNAVLAAGYTTSSANFTPATALTTMKKKGDVVNVDGKWKKK